MTPSRKANSAAKRRQRQGARRGGELVRQEFTAVITRKRFCQLVGIHPTTLEKWEDIGVVKPRLTSVMNSPTRVFTAEDVEFGRQLIKLLRKYPGELSVKRAARMARDA